MAMPQSTEPQLKAKKYVTQCDPQVDNLVLMIIPLPTKQQLSDWDEQQLQVAG